MRGRCSSSARISAKGTSHMSVRVAFVGTGVIANYAHFGALGEIEDVEIVGMCDVDPGKAEKAAEAHGGRVYVDYREMLDKEKPDAVFVCVPPFAHSDIELEAAKRGVHLFVEKPVGLSMERVLRARDVIDDAGVICAVGYHWRYNSLIEEARLRLQEMEIPLVLGYWVGGMPPPAWWRVKSKSGGQHVEQTTHIFDMARHIVGEASVVFALGHSGLMQKKHEDHDIEDATTVAVGFRNGTVGNFTSADFVQGQGKIGLHVFTDQLVVEMDLKGVRVVEPGAVTERPHPERAHYVQDRVFIDAVRSGDGSAIRSSYDDAVRTLELTLAADESMKTGAPVKVGVL